MSINHIFLIIFGLFFIAFGVLAQSVPVNRITINPGETAVWVIPENVKRVKLIYKRKDGSIIQERTISVNPEEVFELQTFK